MKLRFAFDIGTNSIGWAVWEIGLDETGIFGPDAPRQLLAAGVRVFKDGRNPKDGESLAVMRRLPKQSRVRRDRFLRRQKLLIETLITHGLMPEDGAARKKLAELDPYQLRAKGLDEKLGLHEFGRLLFHLNQRRGFQSNRKSDRKAKDNEKGKIAVASEKLAAELKAAGARSYGEWLWQRHSSDGKSPSAPRQRLPVRIRIEGHGAQALYAFYPTRAMLRDEFDRLWESQARFHGEILTPELQTQLRDRIIFFQRPLKPPRIGFCTLVAGEQRLPKALPSVEARSLYEMINNIRLTDPQGHERVLSRTERDLLAAQLLVKDKLSWAAVRKALKLGQLEINYERSGEKELRGSKLGSRMVKADHLGARWREMSWAEKDALVEHLLEASDDEDLIAELMADYQLTEEQAKECANVPLADGYARLGPSANAAILEALITGADEQGNILSYAQAVVKAGEARGENWHHSQLEDGEIFDSLPYYATVLERHVLPGSRDEADKNDPAKYYGRIMNPTVHIGLNQLAQVVNDLIRLVKEKGWSPSGLPDQIIVELARDLKNSKEEKDRIARDNRNNRDANDHRAKKLAELGVENNARNRAKLKLYEEQEKAGGGVALCPFSLVPIPLTALFAPEAKIEIEHLLPYSRTFDDSDGNKVVCYLERNRKKRGKSPYEAFGHDANWPAILANAQKLPKSKSWRFAPDAMEKYNQSGLSKLSEQEKAEMGLDSGFLARQLNETRHLSRLAKAYLSKICDPRAIYVTPGQLTAMLRGRWGLNSILSGDNQKNRDDHRNHALDAVVIGAMTRSFLNAMARQAGQGERGDTEQILQRLDYPYPEFRDQLREVMRGISVSIKPEHGISGALHEETIYGMVDNDKERQEIGNLLKRKPVVDLTVGEIDSVRDAHLRHALQAVAAPLRDDKGRLIKGKEKELRAGLAEFAGAQKELGSIAIKLRHVRHGKRDDSVKLIMDKKTGQRLKAVVPGENHHIDIVQMRDGTWQGFAVSLFDASRKDFRPEWERNKLGGKLVMRLHKNDLIELDDKDGQRRLKQVIRISPSNNLLYLVPHNEAGDYQKRHDDPEDLFRWDFANIGGLKGRKAVAVNVTPAGRVKPRRSNVG